MIKDETKAYIIKNLFGFKSEFFYLAYRKSGKISQIESLFCLRKRNPENIVKIEKILRKKWSGFIKKDLAKKLGVEGFFIKFDDKKNTCVFKSDEGGGWYCEQHKKVEEVLDIFNEINKEQ